MGASSLPESWCHFSLKDVTSLKGGKTPSKSNAHYWNNGSISWASPKDMKQDYLIETKDKVSELSLSAGGLKLFKKGSILFVVRSGILKHTFPVAISKTPTTVNQDLKVIEKMDYLDMLYLRNMLVSFSSEILNNCSKAGTTVDSISTEELAKYPFPLAPLAEQKIIAARLNTQLAQVENLKTRLNRIPTLLKQFRQSVLAAAVSGKLTEEWRGENPPKEPADKLKQRWLAERKLRHSEIQAALISEGRIKKARPFKEPLAPDRETAPELINAPKEWQLVSVSEFAECLDSMRVPVKKDARLAAQGLYPYFGANGEVDRVDEFLFDEDLVMVTEDETFYGRVKPIAYRYSGKCWVNNHAHVLRAQTFEANEYLCYSLMHYHVIPWLSGTTGRAKLTQGALNTLPIGLPPEEEQTEIVRRVEQLFAHADKIEAQVNNAQQRVNNLTQSILAKAFSGEMTADWRAENPDLITGENSAEALLQKIKTEREQQTKTTKTKRKKKT